MTIQLKHLALVAIISAIVGGLITRQYASREVIKTQIVEKEVIKTQDVIQNRDVVITKEIINKDGSREIDTTTVKNTTEDKNTLLTDNKKTSIVDTKAASDKLWFVSLEVDMDARHMASSIVDPTYTLNVSRKILGPVYVGASADTKATLGVFVGLEF